MTKVERLTEMLQPAVEALGFELWGLEYITQGKHSTLRIYIEHENGITVDDCAKVSHQVSGVLDVEDPIKENYSLEVSSPGLDRPLFKEHQYQAAVGKKIKAKTHVPVMGRRNFSGVLESVEQGMACIDVDGEIYELEIIDIDKANIIPTFD